MVRVPLYGILLVTLVTSALVAGLILTKILDVRIAGYVNVPGPTVIEREIHLNISSETGSATFKLGTVKLPAGEFQVKGYLEEYRGDLKLLLSGSLVLKSENAVYEISMPCLASIDEPCYRVAMIIPGYDAPLLMKEGNYDIALTLNWHASGQGAFRLKITGVLSGLKQPQASIEVIGAAPEEGLESWTLANGSTRSYSLYVKQVAPRVVWAYYWVFDPQNSTCGERAVFEVIDAETKALLSLRDVELYRHGVYWKVLVEIGVPGPGEYEVRCEHGNRTLSALVVVTG